MLDWTGERFVPWAREPAVAYEHLHRYIWAATLVEGKQVLDLACGEGYGSDILARRAACVVGIDIDETAVAHALAKYSRPNLQFVKGSVTATKIESAHAFDAIVCFEAIEHIEEHKELLQEVKRLLKPDGFFMVSTPNKEIYASVRDEANPFHVRELSFSEFDELLKAYFSSVAYFGQRIHPGSSIWPLRDGPDGPAGEVQMIRQFDVKRANEEFQAAADGDREAEYFIAIASLQQNNPLPGSVLLDRSSELLHEKDRQLGDVKKQASDAEGSFLEAKRWFAEKESSLENQLKEKDEAIAWKTTQLTVSTKDLDWSKTRIQDLERTVDARDEALVWRARQVENLENEKTELTGHLQSHQHMLSSARQELAAIHASRSWQWVLRARRLREQLRRLTGK